MTAQVSYGFPRINPKSRTQIVGVVTDVKYASLWDDAEPAEAARRMRTWMS